MKNYGNVMKYVGAAVIVGTLALSGCDVFTPGFGDMMNCTRGYEDKEEGTCTNCHNSMKSLQTTLEEN